MLDFLKNKKETETKVENGQNESTPTNIEIRDKWMEVYIKILERYPNIKCWLDFKATGFVNQCDDYMFPSLSPKKHQDLEDYIEQVTGMAESINNQVMENLESFKEFIQNHSPRFVTVGAIPGLGMPEREYPSLYYATDFEIEEFDPKYYKQVLKFYGMDGFHNGFTSVLVFPTAQVIRNMTREEFDKFLDQKLTSSNLTPWDFNEFKEKWTNLYEKTNRCHDYTKNYEPMRLTPQRIKEFIDKGINFKFE